MRQVSIVCTVASLALTNGLAQAPTPLLSTYREASVIGVGSIRNPGVADGNPGVHPARGVHPGAKLTLCRFKIDFDYLIKPAESTAKLMSVLWYVPGPACVVADGRSGATLKALVFLRQERGEFRPVWDSSHSFWHLSAAHPLRGRPVSFWSDPGLALSYVLLAPGIRFSDRDYYRGAATEIGQLVDVVGWTGVLEVLEDVYTEGDRSTRAAVCTMTADWGVCVRCASRASEDGLLPSARPLIQRDIEGLERTVFELLESPEKFLLRFQTPALAKDELTLYACNSSARVRARARSILIEHFNEEPSQIACIPCEQ